MPAQKWNAYRYLHITKRGNLDMTCTVNTRNGNRCRWDISSDRVYHERKSQEVITQWEPALREASEEYESAESLRMRNQDLEMRIRGESPGLEARFSQLGVDYKAALAAERERYTKDVEWLQNALANSETNHANLEMQRSNEISAERESAETYRVNAEAELGSQRQTITNLQEQLEGSRTQFSVLQRESDTLGTNFGHIQADHAKLFRNVDVLQHLLADEKSNAARLSTQLAIAEAKLVINVQSLEHCEYQVRKTQEDLQATLERSGVDRASFSEEMEGVRSLLEIERGNTARLNMKLRFEEGISNQLVANVITARDSLTQTQRTVREADESQRSELLRQKQDLENQLQNASITSQEAELELLDTCKNPEEQNDSLETSLQKTKLVLNEALRANEAQKLSARSLEEAAAAAAAAAAKTVKQLALVSELQIGLSGGIKLRKKDSFDTFENALFEFFESLVQRIWAALRNVWALVWTLHWTRVLMTARLGNVTVGGVEPVMEEEAEEESEEEFEEEEDTKEQAEADMD